MPKKLRTGYKASYAAVWCGNSGSNSKAKISISQRTTDVATCHCLGSSSACPRELLPHHHQSNLDAMPPKPSDSAMLTSKAQKPSSANETSQLQGRLEPPASSPALAACDQYLQAEASTAPTETSGMVQMSLSTDEERQLIAWNYIRVTDPYLSSSDEEDMENVRCSTPFEGISSLAATSRSNSDSPSQVFLPIGSDEEEIENMRRDVSFEDGSTVGSMAGSSMPDCSLGLCVAPQYGSPGYGPLNSSMVDGGVPINMMTSPSTSTTPLPLTPALEDVKDEPSTSERAKPLTPPAQTEDKQLSTMNEEFPSYLEDLYQYLEMLELRRRGVAFNGSQPPQKQ